MQTVQVKRVLSGMLSRRVLRIKVLQIFYAHSKVEGKTFKQSSNDLVYSIHKSYDLYHYLLLLIIETRRYAVSRMELARHKKRPSYEDLNPNTRFVDNRLVLQLEKNSSLLRFLDKNKLSWVNYPGIVRNLFGIISDWDVYRVYMNGTDSSYAEDKRLIIRIFQEIILNYEDLYQNLEEQSIFWLDDIDFILKMVIKSLKSFKEEQGEQAPLLPAVIDKTDLEYAKALLRKAIINQETATAYIEESASNWDLERIAEIDRMIMILAITEATDFETIPTKVTMNEYIEIAKLFSTVKSNQFINGILDSVFARLKAENKISKQGRGLIGEG